MHMAEKQSYICNEITLTLQRQVFLIFISILYELISPHLDQVKGLIMPNVIRKVTIT